MWRSGRPSRSAPFNITDSYRHDVGVTGLHVLAGLSDGHVRRPSRPEPVAALRERVFPERRERLRHDLLDQPVERRRNWSASLALPDCAPTTPSADFRLPMGEPCGPPSPRGASGGSPGVFPAASARGRRIYVMRLDNKRTSGCVAPSSRAPRLVSASLFGQPALSPTDFSPLPSRGYSCPRLPFGVACLGSDLPFSPFSRFPVLSESPSCFAPVFLA